MKKILNHSFLLFLLMLSFSPIGDAMDTHRPVLHAKHCLAITGKPLAATAGAMIFQEGGNANVKRTSAPISFNHTA